MATDTLKSRSITNRDGNLSASPVVLADQFDTTGFNIAGVINQTADYCAPTASGLASTSSTYKLVRLRSNCKIKEMSYFVSTALDTGGLAASLTWDIGAYYSDSATDGTQASLQGALISTSCFFAASVSPAAGYNNRVVSSLIPTAVSEDQMLWDFLGLTPPGAEDAIYGDPGGYIDVVAAVHAGADVAATGNLCVVVNFVP
jgi:hypothetical protein